MENKNNPLLCNPEIGLCELPGNIKAGEKPIKISYFTDPICSSCWGIEPQLRKLKLEYGEHFVIEYRMGGLLPDWSYNSGGISKPSDVAHHWDEVSKYYDMPIDGDIWLEDPLSSSYPPSIAFKAAQFQDSEKAILFLRKIREMVFLEKKNITKWEYLKQAAAAVGLDTLTLKNDFEGRAKQVFQDDLDEARRLNVRGFPTMFFTDTDHNQISVYGFRPYETFENAILKHLPNAPKKNINIDFTDIFSCYPTLTTNEYATLKGISKEKAEEILNKLFNQNQLSKTETKNGVLWKR